MLVKTPSGEHLVSYAVGPMLFNIHKYHLKKNIRPHMEESLNGFVFQAWDYHRR